MNVGKIVLWVATAVFAVVVFGAMFDPGAREYRSPVDRIEEGCKREFGRDQRAEFECNVKTLNRWSADQERAKLDRVYSGR